MSTNKSDQPILLEVKNLKTPAIGGNPANTVVSHLLAERHVELFKLWHLSCESPFYGTL